MLRRTPLRSSSLLLPLLSLLLLGIVAPQTAAAQAPLPPAAMEPGPPGAFAGYALVEASYLLRAPDGTLLRVTRYPAPSARWDASPAWPAPGPFPAAGARVLPAFAGEGWLPGWLLRAPRFFGEVSDYLRESWAMILRLLDYLGVLVLLTASWAIAFLARPMLPGVPDRAAFLLAFALVAGLWLYTTGLVMSVAYALGLMLLPAAVLGAAAWLLRRGWAALRGPADGPANGAAQP